MLSAFCPPSPLRGIVFLDYDIVIHLNFQIMYCPTVRLQYKLSEEALDAQVEPGAVVYPKVHRAITRRSDFIRRV